MRQSDNIVRNGTYKRDVTQKKILAREYISAHLKRTECVMHMSRSSAAPFQFPVLISRQQQQQQQQHQQQRRQQQRQHLR